MTEPTAYDRLLAEIPLRVRAAVRFGGSTFLPLHSSSDGSVPLGLAGDLAARALVLRGIVSAARGAGRQEVLRWIGECGLSAAASPREVDFLAAAEPTRQQVIDATWRAESLAVLLWSLSRLDRLGPPTRPSNPRMLLRICPDSIEAARSFLGAARRRAPEEILALLSLVFDMRWAVDDARINDREPPADLDPSVLHERHYVLNWMTCYCDEAWDDISTDT